MKTSLQISLLFVMVAVLLVACFPGDSQKHAALGEPFELQAGEAVSVGDGEFLVSVVAFGEDSRCPMNALCIVAGQAAVRLSVNGEEVELTLGLDEQKSGLALDGGYTLQLLEIKPFPGSPDAEASAPQSARLVVSAN